MRIILEGCDGTGKTTLAKILAEKYGLDVCHCTQHDAKDYSFYRQTVRKDNVVWDRHTLGELIYPKIFNRKQEIGPEEARLVMHYARKEGTKIFVLTCDHDVIMERLKKRNPPEDNRILDNISKIDDSFKFYAGHFFVPVIDTSKMTLQEIFDLVEEKEK